MNLRECDRAQLLVLPPSVDEWIPEDHLVRTMVSVVERLDLSGLYGRLRADGRGGAAYDPAMMLALLFYCYAIGERSARRIEQLCWQDVAVRFVCANTQPDHATIARFRAQHETAIEELFAQVLGVCNSVGLGRVGTVAVDGTKLLADASKERNVEEDELRRIAREVLEDAARIDAEENERLGDASGFEVPEQLRTERGRQAAIDRAFEELEANKHSRDTRHQVRADERQRLEHEGRPVPPRFQKNQNPRKSVRVNLTDPECRQMRSNGVGINGYNAQAVVSEDQLVVAADISQEPDDFDQLHPMLRLARRELDAAGIDRPISTALADGGYLSEHVIATAPLDSPELLLGATDRLKDSSFEPARLLGEWCESPDSKAMKARRKAIVEPVFGQIKHNRGLRRLTRRGWAAARAEWRLICTTHNLLKLHRALHAAPAAA